MDSHHNHPVDERTRLLSHPIRDIAHLVSFPRDLEGGSSASFLTKESIDLGHTAAGEILPYNDYSSIDFLHDLVKDAYRRRSIYSIHGISGWIVSRWDALSGWLAVAIIGVCTGFVAFLIDVTEATISDWKFG